MRTLPLLVLLLLVNCGGRTAGDVNGGAGGSGSGGSGSGGEGVGGGLVQDCSLPLQGGDCDAYNEVWGHDLDTGVCVPFIYGGCGGNGNRFDSREACMAACNDRDLPYDRCETVLDCVLAGAECMSDLCEPVSVRDLVAVHQDYALDWSDLRCGSSPPDCSPRVPRTRHYFYTACEAGQCVVRDVREQPFTTCTSAADCRLRCGAGCCSSCGSGSDLIAIRNDTDISEELCGGEVVLCALCDCSIPEGATADCYQGHCVDAETTGCTPPNDPCNVDPAVSSAAGFCNPDGTCTCHPGRTLDPYTGRCY